MKQREFEQRHEPTWAALEGLDAKFEASSALAGELPERYRELCRQLALAKHRGYGSELIQRLNTLALALHHRLYSHGTRYRNQVLRFVLADFPRTLRAQRRFVLFAAAVFLLPALLLGIGCLRDPDLVYSVMDAQQVRELESMYGPGAAALGRQRASDTDLMMFGFYVGHNTGIAFQTFGSGIVVGAGPVVSLLYNGAVLGAVSGHLARAGHGERFFPFVIAHGAFELPALVFAGAAGLQLGFAWLAPGSLTRRRALREAAPSAARIIYGTALMLLIAAFIEAFWSSKGELPTALKYAVGAACWLLVTWYCTRAGRSAGSADGPR